MNQLVEDLKAARAVIEKPEAWTKGKWARTKGGQGVSWDSPEAVCFCAEGAIRLTVPYDREVVTQSSLLGHYYMLAAFNDDPETTHAEILALFDNAILKASEAST